MTQKTLFFLDAGHAPDTAGKRSPEMPDGTRMMEWEFAREIVDMIASKLEVMGIAHHIVTPRTDTDLGPTARANLANNIAPQFRHLGSMLISVHGNAHKNEFTDANGVTVLYHHTSSTSKKLAQALQDKIVAASGLRDRGIKGRDNLSILKRTHMPAILSECGFYSNPEELDLMRSHEGRHMFANAHVQFIAEQEAAG